MSLEFALLGKDSRLVCVCERSEVSRLLCCFLAQLLAGSVGHGWVFVDWHGGVKVWREED